MKIVKDTYPQLYGFQKIGVDFLSNSRSALLADEVGTGKTCQAIHACQQVGARSILVICTASIKYNWKKEAIKWGYDERDIYILDNKIIKRLPQNGMFIINYDLCWRKNYARVLFKRTYDVLICDEAHYLKNHKAKRTKAVWLSNGYADLSTYRWMITATPVLNRPVELHPMLKKLCPERLGQFINFIAYTQRYCDGKDGKWGYEALGAENLEELAGRLEGFMLRRDGRVLPDKVLQKIYLPFTKEIEKYLFTGKENESIRRKIGLGKVDPSVEIIANLIEAEAKIVVFAYHIDVIIGLAFSLAKYKPAVLYGATPTNKRQEVIDRFIKDPECKIFIGQIQAAGEGIDGLQQVARVGVFVEIAHTPGIIKQAIGRLYREGQKRPCVFQFLIVEGTIDEGILDNTLFKDKNIKTIMKDEKLGLDFSQTKKEKEMTIENELKRIADALDYLVIEKDKDTAANAPTTTEIEKDSVPIEEEFITPEGKPITDPRKPVGSAKKRVDIQKKAIPAKKTPPAKKPEAQSVFTHAGKTITETYQDKMKGVANRITMFTGDPAKTNILFQKLTKEFTAVFPQYTHVFDVQVIDYEAVNLMVENFLKKEKIQ